MAAACPSRRSGTPLDQLEHGLALVIPGDAGLLVLLDGLLGVGDRDFDGELSLAAIRRSAPEGVLHGIGIAGLGADLERVLADAPRSVVLPQPGPTVSELAIKAVFKDHLRLGRGDAPTKQEQNGRKEG